MNDADGTKVTSESIASVSVPDCMLCGSKGRSLYDGLEDRLFGAPGIWNLKECVNTACGLMWLDPMPAEDEIGKAYPTYYTHREVGPIADSLLRRLYFFAKAGYLARKNGYRAASITPWQELLGILIYLHPGRRARLDGGVMFLPAQTNGLLLDVGCGNGQRLQEMEQLGWRVEGIDIDPKAVASARAKGFEVRVGSLEEQLYPSNHFDAITMNHVIEHVHNPLQLLQECHRLLRPSGRLAIVTPNIAGLGSRVFKEAWLGLDPPRHLHIFRRESLEALMSMAGFRRWTVHTTVAGNSEWFIGSRNIKREGKHALRSTQPHSAQLLGLAYQYAEWFLLKVDSVSGEEIALVAKK